MELDKIGATTEQLYLWMKTHLTEIEYLVLKHEPLAVRVVQTYAVFYRNNGAVKARAERNFRLTMNEYIARDLTITERAKLRELYGVHEDDPESIYAPVAGREA